MPVIARVESAEVVDRIVAVVNDDIITLTELNQLFKPYADQIRVRGYTPGKESKMLFKVREDILNQIIDEKLADQEIERYGIVVSKKEIDNTIERIKKANFSSDEELKSKIVITKEDIKSYYKDHIDKYIGEEKYHLLNIILKVRRLDGEAEKLGAKKKIDAILIKLKEGERFEVMASKYSESPSAMDGGELGLFKIDELSQQLQKIVKGMKAGEFTSVIDTEQGYQIFFVQDVIRSPGKSLEEASHEIQEKLYYEIVNKKYQTWLTELRKRSYIKIIR
jgi:peptidyl-prolyl cis-trans isomerase SurA